MAGISEIYTTKAMLDSQMMHIGKQGKNFLRKTANFKEQIMPKDKYTRIFLGKIEAIVFIILPLI
ncbi:hypothetical protein pdam_00008334 [Pocillopora damicornis]|uniref:Uncharacterized protein n=1 Tax=Pocillopora damicornis TaxID=46731 RepID=A0A3M6U5M6_POCDA|nr:hypothetical protein pdam_00008334 [Pocillopora damicornis]